uniref:Bardet-Biedl syndrome 4 n=1 Tax=Tetraselmis chuii TaxID=63592 RepID=A0A7S1X3Q1_9CHLO|mmetsp:Transcript_25181/g.44903  ORF Transcript_25181/g.44903 Transcript_25181/m.44903 type:complete len:406 (+) Transcript_25181:220-1437(+)
MAAPPSKGRQNVNALLHQLYTRQDYDECLEIVEAQLEAHGPSEYPVFLKATIKRQQGKIQESLQLFQQATALNPNNPANLRQVARSLYLLGKHKAAIEVYEEARRVGGVEDWETMHNKGLCFMYMKAYDRALEAFQAANEIQKHDATYIQIAKVHTMTDDYGAAIDTCLQAIEFSPENPEILTTLGLLYLRMGENYRAFDFLGSSLTHDPKNPKTILAAGSIIQDHSDMDVALIKYRVAAVAMPNSPQLWSNIGMCFFGKQRYIAAIACLKKALYLGPFEWIISYNLGLVHLNTGQYASAFHFFSASVNMKPDFPHSYMYLAITLSKLDDFDNACSAYEKAIEMEADHLFHLNYAITLYKNGIDGRSREHFSSFLTIFDGLAEEAKNSDPDVVEQRQLLGEALGM